MPRTHEALILAAGRGSRLSDQGLPKPLVPFLGVPLLERALRALKRAGIRRVVVATGHAAARIRAAAHRFGRRLGLEVETVEAPDWALGNGASARAAAGRFQGPFLLVMCDHVFAPELLAALAGQEPPQGGLVLAVDRRKDNPLVDPEDVTRVRLEGARITAIGKGLSPHDGYDAGAFLMTPEALARLQELDEPTMTRLVAALAEEGRAIAWDIGRRFWADVDDARMLDRAERALIHAGAAKPHDGPVARRLNRPLSARLSLWLARRGATPMQITWGAFALTVLAAWLIAQPGWIWIALGGLLAQAASILDGCDGEIARAQLAESDYGGWLDAVLDRYADALLLGAFTVHALVHETAGMPAVHAGLAALSGALINSYTADKYDGWMQRHGKAHRFRLGRDVRILALMVFALADAPMALLWLTALVMHAENLRRIWVVRR